MARLLIRLIPTVYPSGADFATLSVPIFPPAPGLFSTITDCFNESLIICATIRPITSAGPPAGKGTTSLIGLDGYASDATAPATRPVDAHKPMIIEPHHFLNIVLIILLLLKL